MTIRFRHYRETDTAYIGLPGAGEGKSVRQVECEDGIVLDFDADGRLLGIEILEAELLLPPELLAG